MALLRAAALVIASCAFAVLLHGSPLVASSQERDSGAAWLTLELFEKAPPSLDKWTKERRSTLAKLEGNAGLHAFTDVAAPERAVAVSLWTSIEALEDASLALDGSDDPPATRKVHFRRLRTSTFDASTPAGHLEVVVHRTRKGTSRQANLDLFDNAEADFSQGAGLLGHSLWISPDGQWLHVLHWRSAEDFAKTGKSFMRTKGVGAWIRSLDFQRFQMFRGDVKP